MLNAIPFPRNATATSERRFRAILRFGSYITCLSGVIIGEARRGYQRVRILARFRYRGAIGIPSSIALHCLFSSSFIVVRYVVRLAIKRYGTRWNIAMYVTHRRDCIVVRHVITRSPIFNYPHCRPSLAGKTVVPVIVKRKVMKYPRSAR